MLFLVVQVQLVLGIALDERLTQCNLVQEQVFVIDFQLLRLLVLMPVHVQCKIRGMSIG